MKYGPWARIILRYIIGAVFMGSGEIGQQLAADPDLVQIVAAGLGLAVEGVYIIASKRGWKL